MGCFCNQRSLRTDRTFFSAHRPMLAVNGWVVQENAAAKAIIAQSVANAIGLCFLAKCPPSAPMHAPTVASFKALVADSLKKGLRVSWFENASRPYLAPSMPEPTSFRA